MADLSPTVTTNPFRFCGAKTSPRILSLLLGLGQVNLINLSIILQAGVFSSVKQLCAVKQGLLQIQADMILHTGDSRRFLKRRLKHVLIDQGYLTEDNLDKEYLRWLYTAVTRSTQNVYLINFEEKMFE